MKSLRSSLLVFSALALASDPYVPPPLRLPGELVPEPLGRSYPRGQEQPTRRPGLPRPINKTPEDIRVAAQAARLRRKRRKK